MLERERHRLVLKMIEERDVIGIADLVDMLGASEATVRRDISTMAERGEVRRVRGGVEALLPRFRSHLVATPFALSQGIRASQKRAIGRAAAALIEPGESIVINGGSTTFCLVDFLTGHELDILTNSFPIATALVERSRNRITLPGGTVYREQGLVLSPFESDVSVHFWGSKLFTGCHGLNRFGLMETDPLVVNAQTRLLGRAEQLVVMADSRKLRQRSSMIVAPMERIATLVTDDGASAEELEPFRAAGVRIVLAAADDGGDRELQVAADGTA